MKLLPITAIVLTHNEAKNIEECLASITPLIQYIYLVDSGSTDKTIEIALQHTNKIVTHPFENYSQQRNWALKNLSIETEWVLQMDADHRMTKELQAELQEIFSKPITDDINGFMVSRKTIFLGKWIKWGGHYPTYHNILFRKCKGFCEEKLYDQHYKVEGKVLKLKGDMIDILTDSLSSFTARHNKWSSLEALSQIQAKKTNVNEAGLINAKFTGNPIQRRRYIKSLYEKMPLFIRPFIYFFIRYFLKLGFLDGRRGMIFHFLQCFWFRFLVDAKIYEIKRDTNQK